jgi:hypothetical protein
LGNNDCLMLLAISNSCATSRVPTCSS